MQSAAVHLAVSSSARAGALQALPAFSLYGRWREQGQGRPPGGVNVIVQMFSVGDN